MFLISLWFTLLFNISLVLSIVWVLALGSVLVQISISFLPFIDHQEES